MVRHTGKRKRGARRKGMETRRNDGHEIKLWDFIEGTPR